MKGLFQYFINRLFTPHGLIISTTLLSALSWFFSDLFYLPRAYKIQEPIEFGVVLFLMWLFYLLLPSFLGYRFGKTLPIIREVVENSSIRITGIYKVYSFIAFAGFLTTLIKTIVILGTSGFLYSVVTFQTNYISEAIYNDYSIGIYSLRYVLILSFGIAIYRVVIKKKISLIDFLNIIFFLFYIAFFGRRLQLIASLFVFIMLANKNGNFFYTIKMRLIFILGLAGFLLLITATTLRNYGSYKQLGYNNPVIVTIANAAEYLAAPFQVSLGTSNNYLAALDHVNYKNYVDVKNSLSANGAFTHMTIKYGLSSILIMLITCFLMATLAGWLTKQKFSYIYTGLPIILYGFSELWRIELFYKGIFITLLLVSLGVPILYAITKAIFVKREEIC